MQTVDHGTYRRRGVLDGVIDRLFEASDPLARMVDLGQVVGQRRLLRDVLETQRSDPLEVFRAPRRAGGRLARGTQQELAEALSSAVLIVLRRLTCTHEVAQRFVGLVGNPDRREVTGTEAASQRKRVPTVRLDPVTGLPRHGNRSAP